MSNIKSLSDLNGDGSDDDKGKYNDYYAGGEKSGQLVRGAKDEDDDDDDEDDRDRVASLFNKAKAIGARQGTADDMPVPENFRGSGQRLDGSAPQRGEGPLNHVVKFYKNNVFTVDDGPPRSMEDPANMDFINSVSKGECPRELDPGTSDIPVTVNLLRVEEDYEMPKYVAFQGSGRTLGSSGSSGQGASTSASASAGAPSGEWAGVNEAQPTTSLQLRLYDGSRMVARFNHSHTIADIRRFIHALRPDMTDSYQLTTGFPAVPIADEGQSLEAAGLLNAVIIQKK